MKRLLGIFTGIILTGIIINPAFAVVQDRSGRYCPQNSEPYYKHTLKPISEITLELGEESAKIASTAASKFTSLLQSAAKTTLGLFNRDEINKAAVDAAKAVGVSGIDVSNFYYYDLQRCMSDPPCPENIQFDPGLGDHGKCLLIPITPGEKSTSTIPVDTSIHIKYDLPCQEIGGGTCAPITEQTGIAGYISRIYQFGLMLVGLTAFGAIVFGGINYILSAGNVTSQEDAKSQITQAIWGLVLLLMAYVILYTINPALVSLTNPQLEIVDTSNLAKQESVFVPDSNTPETSASAMEGCKLSINTGISLNTSKGQTTIKPICIGGCLGGYFLYGGVCTRCEKAPELGLQEEASKAKTCIAGPENKSSSCNVGYFYVNDAVGCVTCQNAIGMGINVSVNRNCIEGPENKSMGPENKP